MINADRISNNEVLESDVVLNTLYNVAWQGPNIVPASSREIIAVSPGVRLVLRASTSQSDASEPIVLELAFADEGKSIELEEAVSAEVLIKAERASGLGRPARSGFGTMALPQYVRAATVAGLFEVGTTDCARLIISHEWFISAGCLSATFPTGLLHSILLKISKNAEYLDSELNQENVTFLLKFLENVRFVSDFREHEERAKFVDILSELAKTAEFWAEYEQSAFEYYKKSIYASRIFELNSERGVLALFMFTIRFGFRTKRLKISYDEILKSKNLHNLNLSEEQKIEVLLDAMKNLRPGAVSNLSKDAEKLLKTGEITRRGIHYNLNEIGITTKPTQIQFEHRRY